MKVKNRKVFNLMDTNGRRNDVINALQIYLRILDLLVNKKGMKWGTLPEDFSQFMFYKNALALSPEVFKEHGKYDKVLEEINSDAKLSEAFNTEDSFLLKKALLSHPGLQNLFDEGIEDRARHYTSTLVKLGFTDKSRSNLTEAGKSVINNTVTKDSLERLLPISTVNLLYLRQLLKLRIFDDSGKKYYSPFCFALYLLLKKDRVSSEDFEEMIQGLSPYHSITDIDDFIESYSVGDLLRQFPPSQIFGHEKLDFETFEKYFKNQKSATTVQRYYDFYTAFFKLAEERNQSSLNAMLTVYEVNKALIVKAFGFGRNLFNIRNAERPPVDDFLTSYEEYFKGNINNILFEKFEKSKQLDTVREYSDTTIRIFKASGIISFASGFVELINKDLYKHIFLEEKLKGLIFGSLSSSDYEQYEYQIDSYFSRNISLEEIFSYTSDDIGMIESNIRSAFDNSDVEEISQRLIAKRRRTFEDFIEATYPVDKIKQLLVLFSDRRNDSSIKNFVCPDATVPTIYEYIIGIAWYYFSNKTIDLLSSFNLTLSANFEPLVHAGGGQGDIVIYEQNKVVMLEATLMNANSQKRGEWEPVLRHSVNLKIDEETKKTGRKVITFFIADEFDWNTINIWKAVASVPLQSSVDKNKFTDNVAIMPINNQELSSLIDESDEYDNIIDKVLGLLKVDSDFNFRWREDFMHSIFS